jgi:hypothetical protein
LDYAQDIQNGVFANDERVPASSPFFEKDNLIEYFKKCPENYIVRSDPRRFLKQRCLYENVTGTECMAVSVEVSTRTTTISSLVQLLLFEFSDELT